MRAPIEGEIVTTGFDLKQGKELKPDQELLSIVNLKAGLTGDMEIDEQDITALCLTVEYRLEDQKALP